MPKYPGLFYLEDLQELFFDVQLQRIYPDQKTFADCIPLQPVADILERYRRLRQADDFDIAEFINSSFKFPKPIVQPQEPWNFPIEEHIQRLWELLSRRPNEGEGTLIPLPYSSVVPGGRFREIFYWDSYFTMLGMKEAGLVSRIEDMLANFAYLIDMFGFIPNGNRTYFLTRSQPPFFSLMVELLRQLKGDEVLLKYLPQLTAEHNFWMQGAHLLSKEQRSSERTVLMPDGEILNRYWDELNTPRMEGYAADLKTHEYAKADPSEHYRHLRGACESGWDFSSRWFRDGQKITTIHTCDLVPVDLNCLLWCLENTLAEGYRLDNKSQTSREYSERADSRRQAIEKYGWNKELQTYCDYDFVAGKSKGVMTMAMAFPLFAGLATRERAGQVLRKLETCFLHDGGLLTTLQTTGQQWDSPNGWAPLQWIGYQAAIQYGQDALAEEIAVNWTRNVETVFARTGKLMEKYHVLDLTLSAGGGEYQNQDGFGWTNGVYASLKKRRNRR
ncbi:MAG: alpha,alpha-trehalase TreF [Chitinophagaceae bacterium]